MQKAGRVANLLKQIGQKYIKDAQFQDVAETAIGAGVAGTGQALFTDMSPEEIALSTALGFGSAIAARPLGARLGGAIGKHLDKKHPQAIKNWLKENDQVTIFGQGTGMYPNQLAAQMPGSPQQVRILQDAVRQMEPGKQRQVMRVFQQGALSKYNQNMRGAGDIEGLLRAIGRYYSDNVAQGGVAISVPLLLAALQGEEAVTPV